MLIYVNWLHIESSPRLTAIVNMVKMCLNFVWFQRHTRQAIGPANEKDAAIGIGVARKGKMCASWNTSSG